MSLLKCLSAYVSLLGLLPTLALASGTESLSTPLGLWLTQSGTQNLWLLTGSDLPQGSTWMYFEQASLSPAESRTGVDQLEVGPYSALKELLQEDSITWSSSAVVSGYLVDVDGKLLPVDGVFLMNAQFGAVAQGEVFFTVAGIHATLKDAELAAADSSRTISEFISQTADWESASGTLPSSDDSGEVLDSCFSCRMGCSETLRLDQASCFDRWASCILDVGAVEIICVLLCHESPACIVACGAVGIIGANHCAADRTACSNDARRQYNRCLEACGPITY